MINETWYEISDTELNIDGYSVYRLDRQNGQNRGGVLCYVTDSVSSKHNVDLHDNDIEAIFVEINLPKTKPRCLLAAYIVHQTVL